MLLSECRSFELLPRFAQNAFIESVCSAIDVLVKSLAHRCDALPCEASEGALSACRDDELAQIADDLGVIPYYPDLPRATREDIILQAKLWTRKAGTCEALRVMVNAVFDTDTTTVEDDLEKPYHFHISVGDNFAESSKLNFKRFNECIVSIGHTTTVPDGMTFYYEGSFETGAVALSGDVLVWYDTDSLCEYPDEPIPPSVSMITGGTLSLNSQGETIVETTNINMLTSIAIAAVQTEFLTGVLPII